MAHIEPKNRSNVDQNAIDDVEAAANMPSGEIRLIAGDPLLPDHQFQALTIPRAHVPFLGSAYGLNQYREEQWDCGVLIGERGATLQSEYPAFFAFLLGHELWPCKNGPRRSGADDL